MGYTEHLKSILRPLGVYNLISGYGAAELDSLGRTLDGCESTTLLLENESRIDTAETFGLSNYEEILPKIPVYINLEMRRNAIKALLRINDSSFTVKAINDTISACGVDARAEETEQWYKVNIMFPGRKGMPQNFEKIKERIESIIPCHLECVYIFVYLMWKDLEGYAAKWNDIEGLHLDWNSMETFG